MTHRVIDEQQAEFNAMWVQAGLGGIVRALVSVLIKTNIITLNDFRDALRSEAGERMLRREVE